MHGTPTTQDPKIMQYHSCSYKNCDKPNIFLLFDFLFYIFCYIVIVNIGVEINLSNKTFKLELENKSSPAYKKLEQDVHAEVTHQNFYYECFIYIAKLSTYMVD